MQNKPGKQNEWRKQDQNKKDKEIIQAIKTEWDIAELLIRDLIKISKITPPFKLSPKDISDIYIQNKTKVPQEYLKKLNHGLMVIPDGNGYNLHIS